jgi:eukaryotic-like serine/threonine-protein kinase
MKPAPLDTDRLVGDRYILESLIAKGGMGEVWRARHKALKSLVAIKFLHRASAFSQSKRKRFLTEAQVTANLKTRHAVQVFDFGVTEDGLPYLVMEFLEGETLEKRIAREGCLSIETTCSVLRQAARALDRAHALGIVHRDFKPENIIIFADEEGGEQVKVVDFGIAKIVGDLELPEPLSRGSSESQSGPSDSANNTAVGTPYYMAPEQIQDATRLGPAADIWAFGIVAYECLTGRRPFDDESVPQLLRRIVSNETPIPASTRAPLPAMFDDWWKVACAREPEDRFPDALTAVSALALALDMPSVAASIARTSGPGAAPAPKRVVSPLAATLDARSSARPPKPSRSEIDPALRVLPPPSFEAPLRPLQVATDAPIEPAPRLSRTGRPTRLPLGVVFLAGIVVLTVTTIALERRTPPPVRPPEDVAPARGADAPAVTIASAQAATAVLDAPATSAGTLPTVASAGSPSGVVQGRAAPRPTSTPKRAAPARAAPRTFQLPPLGL